MKRTPSSDTHPDEDDLIPEYTFDYSRGRPNRFAAAREPGSRLVVLEPDVAKVFTTQEAVNTVLRALIATMPKARPDSGQ
jgi:hypothetical protein